MSCALALQHVSVEGGLSLLCSMLFLLASFPFSPLGAVETFSCLLLPAASAYGATLLLLRARSVSLYPLDVYMVFLAGTV